jgi:hypothetical protein
LAIVFGKREVGVWMGTKVMMIIMEEARGKK